MCDRRASPDTGAPTSASAPMSAHASTTGARCGSSSATTSASSSYPVSDSSGKTTTRVPAERTAAACANALPATSYETHGGWATAMVRGSRTVPNVSSLLTNSPIPMRLSVDIVVSELSGRPS